MGRTREQMMKDLSPCACRFLHNDDALETVIECAYHAEMRERLIRVEAQLAEAREQSSDARFVATLLMRDCKREGGGNLGHMNAALRLIGFMGDYMDWCVAGKPLPEMEQGRLVGQGGE